YQIILIAEPAGPNTCANSDTLWVQVNDQFPQIAIEPTPILCADGDPVDLHGMATPPGGEWAGPGVDDGTFYPALSGAGDFLLTYTASLDGCLASQTLAVKVLANALVSAVDGLAFCPTDAPGLFTAFPAGGTWGAPLQADGHFDPSGLAPGSYPVAYTWTGPNGCELQNEPLNAVVLPTTIPVIEPLGPLCANGQPVPVAGSPQGTWGGAVTVVGDIPMVDPAALGVGEWPITLTAAAPGECPGTSTGWVAVEICSLAEGTALPQWRVWPNPFTGGLWLEAGSRGALAIVVLDATGRTVLSHGPLPAGNRVRLDLDRAPAGVYFVHVTEEGAVAPRMVRIAKE
ncbi:MAG: T9SS type A sorting domain-containing protein, partial [Flavobacteriales bacterium]